MISKATLAALVLASAPLLTCAGVNAYAQVSVGAGNYISRMSGKMVVPENPRVPARNIWYLWPGLDPSGQVCGLFQPVLSYRQGKWTVYGTFSKCKTAPSGYCETGFVDARSGDIVSWWITNVGGRSYQMGYSTPYGTKTQTYSCANGMPTTAWLTEVETYFDISTNPGEYLPWLPSSFKMYDVQVLDRYNRPVTSGRQCVSTAYEHVSCDWNSGTFTVSFGGGGGPPPPPPPSSCQDRDPGCGRQKSLGYCNPGPHYQYSSVMCMKTCGFCGGGPPPPPPPSSCQDRDPGCGRQRSLGYCNPGAHYQYSRVMCMKTCGFCRSYPALPCNGDELCEALHGQVPGLVAQQEFAASAQNGTGDAAILVV